MRRVDTRAQLPQAGEDTQARTLIESRAHEYKHSRHNSQDTRHTNTAEKVVGWRWLPIYSELTLLVIKGEPSYSSEITSAR